MKADERHQRLTEIQSEIATAQELRGEYQQRLDALFVEQELLQSDCYDEDCPCTLDLSQ